MPRLVKHLTIMCWFLACPFAAALSYKMLGGGKGFVALGVVATLVAIALTFEPLMRDRVEDPRIGLFLGWTAATVGIFIDTGLTGWHWPIVIPERLVIDIIFLATNLYVAALLSALLSRPARRFMHVIGWS